MRTVFFAFALFFAGSCPALGSSLELSYTHHTAITVPELSDSSASFKLARTWFLPDWQAGLGTRADTAPTGSGDRHDLTCATYGGCLGVPANMTCLDDFSVDGKNCYKSCSCKPGYNHVSTEDICAGCANPCLNLQDKNPCTFGCKSTYSSCPSKCETCYADNCHNRTPDPDKGFGCKQYFSDCPSECETAYSDNCHNREADDDNKYGCEKYFDDCSSKCEKAYTDNCRNYPSKPLASSCANGCALGKTLADCASRCSTGCKASCETGYYLSADELSCSYDLCQKYGDKPLVSSCANGCALGQTADGCSSRCATGCKASCSSPKELTADQLSCQCPANYIYDGTDPSGIAYGKEECDGKRGKFHPIYKDDPQYFLGFLGFNIKENATPKSGYSIFSISFSFRGKSYSYGYNYRDFSDDEKSSPETVVSDCTQLTKAFNDNTITNIRINGHIICDAPLTAQTNKNIYGSNRNTDKIEFKTEKGFETTEILKFSNLSLISSGSNAGNCDSLFPDTTILLQNVSVESGGYNTFSKWGTAQHVIIMKDSITLKLKKGSCKYIYSGKGDMLIEDGAVVNLNTSYSNYEYGGEIYSKGKLNYDGYLHLSSGTRGEIYKAGNGYIIFQSTIYSPHPNILTDGATYTISGFGSEYVTGNNVTLNTSTYDMYLSAGSGTTINYASTGTTLSKTFTNGLSPYITQKVTYSMLIN